jgi:hypothetical protein
MLTTWHPLCAKVGNHFADKRRQLGRCYNLPPSYTKIFIFSLDTPSLAAAYFPSDSASFLFSSYNFLPFSYSCFFSVSSYNVISSYPFTQLPSLLLLLRPHQFHSIFSLQINIKSVVTSSPTFELRSYVAFPLVCIEEHVWESFCVNKLVF